jgi:hypothetical protein
LFRKGLAYFIKPLHVAHKARSEDVLDEIREDHI